MEDWELPKTDWTKRHAQLKHEHENPIPEKKQTMDIATYQAEAENTKSQQFNIRFFNESDLFLPLVNVARQHPLTEYDIIHAIIGISTEGGELLDAVKKLMFYGKPLDMVNLDEEIGDVLWYIAIYANARGTTIEKLAELNNLKLRQRYPNKFQTADALNRDLDAERKVLEASTDLTDQSFGKHIDEARKRLSGETE